ncbi:sugar kinase [Clostridium cavendishii]|nr:sugar kinase [Clostridium cavendishii]
MGEIMLRLSPPFYNRILETNSFDVSYGGAEANVAVLLSSLGIETEFVTKLPNNYLGEAALRYLKQNSVKTSFVKEGGKRLGIYYLEKGHGFRNSKVVYDREDSAMAIAKECDFDFENIFKGVDLFHISTITAMISDSTLGLTLEAIRVAKAMGVKISIDLNYRGLLSNYDKFYNIAKLMLKDADICFGWLEKTLPKDFKVATFDEEIDYEYFKTHFDYMRRILGVKNIVTTLRRSVFAEENSLIGLCYDGSEIRVSKEYNFKIIDRVGGGDAFAGGVIFSLLNGYSLEASMKYGVAASVIKHSIEGDAYSGADFSDIQRLATGSGSAISR